ncbi:nucleoside triphosphate pyrophosphohydrolase [Pseudalkalibacillus sp. A8]|uniref:nucleoside triphosphate pyrophosphohydrolase n=1 Tax=Pseudalkalibacillus sp. A8 TaxID=3382641 RepID=UPI0038B63D8B
MVGAIEMPVYSKLVRVRIPEIIDAGGDDYETRILDEKEYLKALEEKAGEELKEYQDAEDSDSVLEELADLMEVVYALAKARGFTIEELESIRNRKADVRGGVQSGSFYSM